MHKHAAISLLLITAHIYLSHANTAKCSRMPEGTATQKSPPDGRFRLRVINEPIRFIPGESYNMSLEGVTRHLAISPQKFIAFFLTVERSDGQQYDENDDIGRFQIIEPAISKISEKCNNLVVNTNTGAKPAVTIQWTAPQKLKGCITFRSTIIEHRDIWFMDEGALSKTLCEDEADSLDMEPFQVTDCKACHEAKYELVFEGLWTRNTHPKDFPDDGWLTKFTDVIGASHAIENSFWKYGEQASFGMKDVAEHGATLQLEEELKEKGEAVRTIIKARGISYPNINGRTFAVFRADAQHHLLSLVSKIYPSPDWFVGVSDLELCLENGQWIENKEINLYPYDAGTDSGATYTAPDQPTLPLEAIRRIKPNNPNDPRSPFYDSENKEMKPLAKLYIIRQRLYEKTCENNDNDSADDGDDDKGDDDEDDNNDNGDISQYCETQEWGRWSDCNNNCGDGQRVRRRYYKDPETAQRKGCSAELTQREDCVGRKCTTAANIPDNRDDDKGDDQNGSNEDEDAEAMLENDPKCKLSEWAEDDECSCETGRGQKKQTRDFKRNKPFCTKKYPTIELEKFENCESDCKSETTTMKIGLNCPLTKWSAWSKCSAKCGRGQQIRVRKPTNRAWNSNDDIKEIVDIYNKLQGSHHDLEDILRLEITTVSDPNHACYRTELVQIAKCGMQNTRCENNPSYICSQPPVRGKCDQPPEMRFYYSWKEKKCGVFVYTGCDGSLNNFETYDDCLSSCKDLISDEDEDTRPQSLIDLAQLKVKVNCEVTKWKFTPCNATCGEGHRWKYRQIIKNAENGGRACPTKLRQLEKCRVDDDCEPVSMNYRDYRPQPHIVRTTTTTTDRTSALQCEYSEWSNWSPCSKSCGDSAIKIRTRSVLNYENYSVCVDRLQTKPCTVLPCLVDAYNYRNRAYYRD